MPLAFGMPALNATLASGGFAAPSPRTEPLLDAAPGASNSDTPPRSSSPTGPPVVRPAPQQDRPPKRDHASRRRCHPAVLADRPNLQPRGGEGATGRPNQHHPDYIGKLRRLRGAPSAPHSASRATPGCDAARDKRARSEVLQVLAALLPTSGRRHTQCRWRRGARHRR